MRRIQMVGLGLALVGFGCSSSESPRLLEASILPDCKPVQTNESTALSRKAEAFFKSEVGVPVAAVKIGPISNCAERFVVPVEAMSTSSKEKRLWFVEVDKADESKMALVRPE